VTTKRKRNHGKNLAQPAINGFSDGSTLRIEWQAVNMDVFKRPHHKKKVGRIEIRPEFP